MSLLQNIISITVIVFIVTGILSLFSKKKEKLDKGFTLSYFNLSYRRKMIRTLWMLLIMFISLVAYNWYVDFSFKKNLIISIIFLTLFLIQLAYNYYKWKKYER
ncbi:hypothetical protein [Neobacillus sp.]|uniref:hypothetical protein n=1 Tax=Neobacillus sp. TaxID=2675273 RepID=UPI0028A2401A|nr:hypothetical protein [Neobacillus sp.]